jgi:hypothetical protein
MFTLDVKHDVQPMINKLNSIAKGLGDKAVVSSLNKTVAQARTQISRGIREEFNISAALVRERLSVQRARRAGLHFTATLIGNPHGRAKRAMNLIHFVERKTTLAEARRRGKAGTLAQLYFKVKRSGGKQTLPGAFIGNQGRTVFIRVGKGRTPIKAVQTIGVPQMFETKRVQQPVQRWIQAEFPRIFASEVRYYLSTVR